MHATIDIRAYQDLGAMHSHDFIQVVLPLQGELEIEVGGRGARLSPLCSAFIAPGVAHTQAGLRPNRSLVLDAPVKAIGARVRDQLGRQRFFCARKATRGLMAFAAERSRAALLGTDARAALTQLLIGAINEEVGGEPMWIEALGAAIRADPAANWSVGRMAREVGVSRSALYRRLETAGEVSAGRFVTRQRLQAAGEALRDRSRSLAEIAVHCGFCDQAAMTRAMRREIGRTPGAWRRRQETFGQDFGMLSKERLARPR